MSAKGHRPGWVYALAVVGLVTCLWNGWSDFTPWVPQEIVQQTVRDAIRQIAQLFVQFIAPALLVAFLVSEGLAIVGARRKA